MAISQVIRYEGSPDDLVWKYSGEEFNATSQLIVDETHQAVLVVNGQAADLFGPGRHTLSVPNIPIVKKIINIPTGGESPFPCKVFYISQVHQMDMLWGIRGPITLDDPLYDIFFHVMLHGSITFSIADSRKFLVKLAGFRNRFTATEMVDYFKGLVSAHVKDCISKIMINGMLSYFMINANLFEISETAKERLDSIFDEYGIRIEYFNIETIEVPKAELHKVAEAIRYSDPMTNDAIAENCEIEANNTKGTFTSLAEEFNAFEKQYLEYDRYYEDIEAEFAKL